MKSLKFYGLFFAAFVIAFAANSQDAVIASSTSTTPATEITAATTTTQEPEEKEEKKEDEPTFSLSGSVDTYFRTGFGYKTYAPASSFANLKGFGLGMVNLIASYEGEKVGFVGDLVFGPRGRDALFNVEGGIINQLFVYYNISDKVKLNLGQFNTFLGYEVISPAVNFHYSTSYLFSYGPFNHTGLRADFDLGGGMVAKLAVMNPTDILEFNPVNTYTLGGQIGHSNDAGGIWLNFLYGDQDGKLLKEDFTGSMAYSAGSLFQADLTTGYNLGEKFYIGLNTSYQTVGSGEAFTAEGDVEDVDEDATSFFGVAIYPKVAFSESFSLGVRLEQFMIKKGHLDIIGLDDKGNGNVTALTLSANYKVGGLTIIPEVRMDMASEDSFIDKNNKAQKSLSSFTLAAVYAF
jgi:hypothetical protein